MISKILFISAFPPNQKTAGQDYTRRLILDLLSKGYYVDLIYAEYPNHEVELPSEVNVLKVIHPGLKNCIRKCYIHPFFSKRYENETKNFIQEIADGYDMLYFDFSQVHLYSLYINHPLKVTFCHDIIFQKYDRHNDKANVRWIKFWESKLLKSANHVVTVSKKDSKLIKDMYGLNAYTVNNYLKVDRFVYAYDYDVSDRMCLYGAWNRKENIESIRHFMDKILPNLKKKRQFVVIGGGMGEALKRKINNTPNIEYLGFVENPILEISRCQALIAPLYHGAGVKIKVLDALSVGTPVIGTQIAFEGIDDNDDYQLFHLINNDDEFISTIDGMEKIGVSYRQKASNEFCTRFNRNHFPDIINLLSNPL